MATVPFRFPSLSLSRSPSSTTTTTTYLSYSHSTTHLSYFRSIFPLHYSSSSSSGRTIPVRCKSFATHEPDGDDESGNETLEMYRAFLERIFENSSEDELEACIEKQVERRLIARARKFLTEYLEKKEDEKKKDEEGPGHEDE